MAQSAFKTSWIPILAACIAAGGASYIRGQSQPTWDELDFVPPSPAPSHVVPATIPALGIGTSMSASSGAASSTRAASTAHQQPAVSRIAAPSVSRQAQTSSWSNAQFAASPPNRLPTTSAGKRSAATGSGPTATTRPLANPALSTNPGARAANTIATNTHSGSRVTPLGQLPVDGKTVAAGYLEPASDPMSPSAAPTNGTFLGFRIVHHHLVATNRAAEQSEAPFGLPLHHQNAATALPTPFPPMERLVPPAVIGSQLGLQPGETATERSLRLMSAIEELEQHVGDATQQNANLHAMVKQRDEKLLLAVREVRAARKDLASAKEELERLKQEINDLREKVRSTEKENAAVLQTMAPLLQQLLESEDISSRPAQPSE